MKDFIYCQSPIGKLTYLSLFKLVMAISLIVGSTLVTVGLIGRLIFRCDLFACIAIIGGAANVFLAVFIELFVLIPIRDQEAKRRNGSTKKGGKQ